MKNQQLLVKIGNHGVIEIGHKTGLAKANEILIIGNNYRRLEGITEWSDLQNYFRSESTWRTIISIYNKIVYNPRHSSNSYNNCLLDMAETMKNLPRVSSNTKLIDYPKILATGQFANIIKTQRGGRIENRGVYVQLHLLIDIAMAMNEQFKVEVIDTFIRGQLLEHREEGGEAFKRLNDAINTLSDRTTKSNKGCYINAAKMINKKINGQFKKGWNDEEKDSFTHSKRDEYLKQLIMLINMGYVNSWLMLKDAMEKLK